MNTAILILCMIEAIALGTLYSEWADTKTIARWHRSIVAYITCAVVLLIGWASGTFAISLAGFFLSCIYTIYMFQVPKHG